MKKLSFQSATLLACSILFFASCQKSSSSTSGNVANQQQLTAVSASDGEAADIYNNVFDNVMGSSSTVGLGTGIGVTGAYKQRRDGGLDTSMPGCATVTIDTTLGSPNGFPVTVTINFGTGCTGRDGHTRMGQIVTVFTGPILIPGSTATTTFNGYYVDSIHVSGTHIITNASSGGTFSLNVQVENGMLTAPSGNYIAWNNTRAWTLVGGGGTSTLLDDVFSITGNSSGTVVANDSTYQWTTSIVSSDPEIRKLDCPWIVQGQSDITWNGISAVLDFGTGSCDNQATVAINGHSFTITLP